MATDIRDRIVELRRVPASELRRNEKNWRRHPAAQQNALKEVLAKVGFADALLARETPDGLILIDGHLRADIAPEVVLPVLILDVDEKEADYILATLDPLAAMAETDQEALAEIMNDIEIEDGDLLSMLSKLAGLDAETIPDPDPKDDEVPESAPPISREGYIWRLGEHMLICGDSTKAETYERLLGDEVVDLVWTDPPYGVDYVGKTKSALKIDNDKLGMDELESFLSIAFAEAAKVTKPGGSWYVAAPSGPQFLAFAKILYAMGIWHQTIIWVKDVFVMGRSEYHWRHESIFYGWVPGGAHQPIPDRKQDTVWEIDRPKASRSHPTMKPVELIYKALLNSCDKGDLVLDPFGGSGSTLVAANKVGRRARLIELDPKYCDVICRRYQELTDVQPVLASSGESFDFTADFFAAQEEAMAGEDAPEREDEPVTVPAGADLDEFGPSDDEPF